MSEPLYTLHLGDCLEVMRTLPDCSVDAVVTDPPAGIGFMGAEWDKNKGGKQLWKSWMQSIASECLRVLKPGGYAIVWALPRTSHWTQDSWEDAGFIIRDKFYHLFSTGFPKTKFKLKPAVEEWVLFQKVGAKDRLNIELCRDECNDNRHPSNFSFNEEIETDLLGYTVAGGGGRKGEIGKRSYFRTDKKSKGIGSTHGLGIDGEKHWDEERQDYYVYTNRPESCGKLQPALNLFYCAKAVPSDKSENGEIGNSHPTSKNTKLMQWLCRLITPPNGLILDCFMGSGSTGKAAMKEGFRFIGIEQNPEYVAIAEARIIHAIQTVGLTPEKAATLTPSISMELKKDVPLKLF